MHRWVSETFSILTFLTCPSSARLSTSLSPFILSSGWSWCWVLPRIFSFYFEHPFECSCLVRWAPLLLSQLLLPGVRPNIGNQLSIMRNVEGWALATLEIIWEKKTLGCFPGQVLWGTSTSRQRWDWVFLHEQARLLPMTYLFLVWRCHTLEVKSTILSLDHILSWCEDQERLIICNHLFPVDNRHWNLNLEDLKIHEEEEEHFPGKHLPSKSFLQGSCQWKASLSLTQAQQTGQGYQLGKPKSSSLLLTFVVIAHLATATVGVFFSVPCASAAPTLSSMGLNPGVDFLSVQGHRSFFSWKALRRWLWGWGEGSQKLTDVMEPDLTVQRSLC